MVPPTQEPHAGIKLMLPWREVIQFFLLRAKQSLKQDVYMDREFHVISKNIYIQLFDNNHPVTSLATFTTFDY